MLQKVLVVNDNEILLLVSKRMIEISKFAQETITAADGLEALEYFDKILEKGEAFYQTAPEFIFLDLHMPNMDGWEFLEIFTQKYLTYFPNTKVAILSASVDKEELNSLVKFPIVVDFIDSSIDEETLNKVKSKLSQLETLPVG